MRTGRKLPGPPTRESRQAAFRRSISLRARRSSRRTARPAAPSEPPPAPADARGRHAAHRRRAARARCRRGEPLCSGAAAFAAASSGVSFGAAGFFVGDFDVLATFFAGAAGFLAALAAGFDALAPGFAAPPAFTALAAGFAAPAAGDFFGGIRGKLLCASLTRWRSSRTRWRSLWRAGNDSYDVRPRAPAGGALFRSARLPIARTAASSAAARRSRAAPNCDGRRLSLGGSGNWPREQIVEYLDRYIVGCRRAVVALRNRWRRQRVPEPLRDEIAPKNIP